MRELMNLFLNPGTFGFLECPIYEVHTEVTLHCQDEEEVEEADIAMEYMRYLEGVSMGC